jgi:hypothetical protein
LENREGEIEMVKEYKKFVIGETLYEAINKLPDGIKQNFAIYSMQYGIEYKEPVLEGVEAALWITFRDIIDNTRPKKGAQKGNINAIKSNQIDTNENESKRIDTNKTNENESGRIKTNENESGNININLNDNLNINLNENENEKGNGNPLPSFPPFLNPSLSKTTDPPEKNYAMIFEEVKARWKEIIGQETKESLFQVPTAKRERFINTLEIYELKDIFNAIGNYNIARSDPEEFDIGGRVYGNLIGFLENGVSQFYTDGVAEGNFRRRKK